MTLLKNLDGGDGWGRLKDYFASSGEKERIKTDAGPDAAK
jgi:hypothetical protein